MTKKEQKKQEDIELKTYVSSIDKTINYIFLSLGILFFIIGICFIITNYAEDSIAKLPRVGNRLVVINGPCLLILSLGSFILYYYNNKEIQKKKKLLEEFQQGKRK